VEKEKRILEEAIVIDALSPFLMAPPDDTLIEYLKKVPGYGVTCLHTTACGCLDFFQKAAEATIKWNLAIERTEELMGVGSVEDIRKAKTEKKLAIILGTQNLDMIGSDISLLGIFEKLGWKIVQLAYCGQNLCASGGAEPVDSGLTKFGKSVVEELNRLHMLIDLSHCSPKTIMETLKVSKDPIALTHTGPRQRLNHWRNHNDEVLKAVAQGGGVIGIIAFSNFIKDKPPVTLDDYVNNIEYVVGLVGIDHVGIGSDTSPTLLRKDYVVLKKAFPEVFEGPFDYGETAPKGMEDHSCVPKLTKSLAEQYSDQEVKKLLGGNWFRLFKEVWQK